MANYSFAGSNELIVCSVHLHFVTTEAARNAVSFFVANGIILAIDPVVGIRPTGSGLDVGWLRAAVKTI
jgi:hypothetical protein